jgi:hypothetical protein
MTVSQSTRLQIYRWTADTDEFTRAQMDTSHENLESYVAKLTTGTSLPAVSATYNRSFFFKTDTDKLYFYDSSDATGDWREITLDASINKSIFTTAGQILYSTGSATPAVLASGTSGQFLTTNGTAPSWTSDVVTPTGTQTLTNKTLTSPTINTASLNRSVLGAPFEKWAVSTSAISTSLNAGVNLDIENNSGAFMYTGSATNTWIPNIRHSASATLNDNMAINTTLTVSVVANIGSTAAYASTLKIDGSTVTVQWQGGLVPSTGNSSAYDVYSYAVVKKGANDYIVFGSRTKFDTVP